MNRSKRIFSPISQVNFPALFELFLLTILKHLILLCFKSFVRLIFKDFSNENHVKFAFRSGTKTRKIIQFLLVTARDLISISTILND